MRICTIVLIFLTALSGAPAAEASAFTHPGVLVTTAQLDLVRQRLAAGQEPWRAAYDAMHASKYASLSRTPQPREVVECGSHSDPNHGCTEEREDALAAYTLALEWYLTRDRRYADKAIQIMDAWSAVIKDHTNSNAPLQSGWSAASWTRAGELIRHTHEGWPADRIGRFETMLRDVYLPEVENGKPRFNGNWELIMMDAAVGIGVFLDDRAVFDKAIGIWRGRVPAYMYLESDGDYPKGPPNSGIDTRDEIIKYWHGQSTFVDGLAQETCRDFGHTGWGFDAAAHVAETAWIQGLDLYAEMRGRMTKALEFHATYDLGASPPGWLCGGELDTGLGPTLEVAHNHYRNRLRITLPRTLEVIKRHRPAGGSHFYAWETLTHAMNPGGDTAPADRYEAEDGVCQGSVDSNHAGFSGTGFCNTDNAVGKYAEWTVQAASAGPHMVTFRYANDGGSDRPVDVTANGRTAVRAMSFPVTGSWSSWSTVTMTVDLAAGANAVRATATTSGGAANLDYLEVAAS